MPKPRRSATSSADNPISTAPSLPMAEVLSFLKETRGVPYWSIREMAQSLNLSAAVAKSTLPVLQVQGYIEPSEGGDWLTTAAGDAVAGSKSPRYTLQAVEAALAALIERIKAVNQDRSARFRVAKAVAFGDFLSGRVRVQAPDVGVELVPREAEKEPGPGSAVEEDAKRAALKRLKGNRAVLNLLEYEGWMGGRTHRKLM